MFPIMLNPFLKNNCLTVVLKLGMQKQKSLIGSSCVKNDINDKISLYGKDTTLEDTIPHFLLKRLRGQCHGLSILFTHQSDNNRWCNFRISLTPSEYVDTLTCLFTAFLLISTQILFADVLSASTHLLFMLQNAHSKCILTSQKK